MFLLRALTVSGPIISQRIIVRQFIAIEPSLALSSRLGQYRRLSQWPSEESEAVHSKELVYQIKKDSNAKDQELQELTSSETQVATTPWYLRDDTQPKLELSERQRIPDLPESPPPILQPLMQQLSVDLGLDDLSLLDLRKLDPPPALGANLLMLLTTARSEKHLHVSADRLCRWLRSNYQLRPDADGLLGRSELKTRLKRKAKKTKLLGSHDEDPDDGIRSGWICVDAGIVKDAKNIEQVTPSRDFIGFGRRTEGVRIVIQMLTEEKRGEINLEGLWSGILKRSEQEDVLDHDVEESFLTGKEIT